MYSPRAKECMPLEIQHFIVINAIYQEISKKKIEEANSS